jgi:hypothetical protein
MQQPLESPEETLAWMRTERARLEAAGVSMRTRNTPGWQERKAAKQRKAEDRDEERAAAERVGGRRAE